MEEQNFESISEKLREHLDSGRQNWLLGAGISCNSNIPLMFPLTDRVRAIITASKQEKNKELYEILISELDDKAHIEHYLSHLGDLIALGYRAKAKKVTIGGKSFDVNELVNLHKSIVAAIGETVRYGYSKNGTDEVIGNSGNPIVEIEHHIKFVRALYSNRSNLTSRSKLTFFTTNYDTLLEDALALENYTVVDGFSGGAIGYWNPIHEFQDYVSHPNKCQLFKLHGSIDWQRDEYNKLVRTRYGTKYLDHTSDIMIYPQATKYIETQKDPFSYLFSGFRSALNASNDNVLITCGYSFGDDHINAEIEAALSNKNNSTTLIVFTLECPNDGVIINETLDAWITNKNWGNRIYIAGQKGIYYNSIVPLRPPDEKDLTWWTFSGLTNFISTNEHD